MPLQATSGAASYDAFGGGAAAVPNYIEDVFSTWLYTGNGSTQTITNGIDLAGKGGLVWMKNRTTAGDHHVLTDTVTGATKQLASNLTDPQYTYPGFGLTSFNSTGFTVIDNSTGSYYVNGSSKNYVGWTFREQPKFFDVVTYTGNGVAGRQIAHNLGSEPGFIAVKKTSSTGDWLVYHRSRPAKYLYLNSTAAEGDDSGGVVWGNGSTAVAPTSTNFTVNALTPFPSADINANGQTYVAYLFAHNAGGFGLTGTDNVISCGSFTTSSGGGDATVDLGYEPQWLLVKSASGTSGWDLIDNMRGMPNLGGYGTAVGLEANNSNAEGSRNPNCFPTATGFYYSRAASTTYIYIAIRRGPMKVPTTGTSVFSPVAYTGNASSYTISGLSNTPDLMMGGRRTGTTFLSFVDRLRGFTQVLLPSSTGSELTSTAGTDVVSMNNNNVVLGTVNNTTFNAAVTDIAWIASRAPGFFDEVCYTGTGSALLLNHNLGVPPELIITKRRDATSSLGWIVSSLYWFASTPWDRNGRLNQTNALSGGGIYEPASSHSATQYPVSAAGSDVNASGGTYVAYLFATTPGVSKVGLYTGTGTTQTINCGFTAGSRFVMIKRADDVGDWYVWDSARGIVAGNDPYLLLNSTAAEVTSTDFVDTAATGFELSSTAPAALNASGGSYIFLAIA